MVFCYVVIIVTVLKKAETRFVRRIDLKKKTLAD